jgi:hypothetical protein
LFGPPLVDDYYLVDGDDWKMKMPMMAIFDFEHAPLYLVAFVGPRYHRLSLLQALLEFLLGPLQKHTESTLQE